MFLSQDVSFKAYKMYITVIFTHLLWNCTKTENFNVYLRLLLAGKGKLYSICSKPELSESNFCDGLETKFTSHPGAYRRGQAGHNSPGAEWLREALKSRYNATSTFFNTVHLLPKDLKFEMGRQTCFLSLAPSNLVTPPITSPLGGMYGKLAHQKQLRKALLRVLISVSDCKLAYGCLYFIITNFHTELKPQVKVRHGIISPAFTLYTDSW